MDPSSPSPDDPVALVHRLCAATNAHDLDALVACFASDYRNETPVHPERGFVGAVQVRRNWAQIFAAIPDLTTAVVGVASAGTPSGVSGSTAALARTAPRMSCAGW
jgi:hypothetical protein